MRVSAWRVTGRHRLLMQQPAGDRPAGNTRGTRSVVMARNGAIATSQPLATAAGLRVLQSGGNAIDAAVTAAAVLSVVEPTMNGAGGDLFAIVYSAKDKKVHGLNASGRAPARGDARGVQEARRAADPAARRALGQRARRGRRLERAAGEARHADAGAGARAGDQVRARRLRASAKSSPTSGRGRDACWRAIRTPRRSFLHQRQGAGAGRRVQEPGARRLARARSRKAGATPSTRAPIAKAIADDMQRRKGLITAKDLADHHADWVEPMSTTYRGYQVLELPPNTQGVAALEMLNIMEGFDLKALGHNSAAYLHTMVEAKRIAFADRGAWLGDAVDRRRRRRSSGCCRRTTRRSGARKSIPTRRRPTTRR